MSTKTNLIVDTVIFATFLVMSNPHLTGNTIHEWLGVSFAAAIITHLLLHWDWIVNVGKTFFKKRWHQSRLNFVVNSLFFIAITGSLFTGLLISKDVMSTLGIQLAVGGNWKTIHTLMSDVSLIVLGIHVALHWKWIVTNVGRYVLSPIRVMFSRRKTPCASHVLTAQPVRVEKRQ
ncbi:MAG: DUF4405 domain-containing protein [Anaerolineales bacterium]